MTREEAVETLENHTQYFVPVQDLGALNMAIAALRPVSRERLSGFKTCDLVGELRKREGVEAHIAEQYQDVAVSVNGPAVVLVVMD